MQWSGRLPQPSEPGAWLCDLQQMELWKYSYDYNRTLRHKTNCGIKLTIRGWYAVKQTNQTKHVSNCIETKTVFTKTESDNEGNTNFLQIHVLFKRYRDWSCIYPDSKEETLLRSFSTIYVVSSKSIETEIHVLFKRYRDWSCIYPDSKEETLLRSFSTIYVVSSKSIETEAVFTQTRRKKECYVHFLQYTWWVLKVSRLKLYLPRLEGKKNATFIFYNIRGEF